MPKYPHNDVWCMSGMYCVDGEAPVCGVEWNAEQDVFTIKFRTTLGGSGTYVIVLTPEQFSSVWGELTIQMMSALGERDLHNSQATQPLEAQV